tara:strand:- start:3793 stop:4578 length:786 start_codon:yes stop_codon:yes gene_type:complete
MSNRLNQAYKQAYRAAQKSAAQNELRREKSRVLREIDELQNELDDLTTDVTQERQQINNFGSTVGCVAGSIIGAMSGGGIAGAISGCSLGSGVLSTAADYAYDTEIIQSTLEEELKAKAAELESYDVKLSELAYKYPDMGASEWEESLESKLDQSFETYEDWQESFYGKEGLDYAMDLGAEVLDWASTKVGLAALDSLWGAAFPESEYAQSIAKEALSPASEGYDKYTSGSGIGQFTYELPETENLWKQYIVDNKVWEQGE